MLEFIKKLLPHRHNLVDVMRENYYETSFGDLRKWTMVVQRCDTCQEYREQLIKAWIPELNTTRTANKSGSNLRVINGKARED